MTEQSTVIAHHPFKISFCTGTISSGMDEKNPKGNSTERNWTLNFDKRTITILLYFQNRNVMITNCMTHSSYVRTFNNSSPIWCRFILYPWTLPSLILPAFQF